MGGRVLKCVRWIVAVSIVLPIFVLALYKPSRVFAPTFFAVTCSLNGICVDDESRRAEAEELYKLSSNELQVRLGSYLSYKPKLIFCSEQKCFETFGFNKASAQTLGTVATVIGPKGWKKYYLKHELIHQWQADKLGGITMYLAPQWVREGMAYALSNDPRSRLSEPWQSYREKFMAWYSGIDQKNLIVELKAMI